jgi:N-methylhydantoinase A
VQKGRDPRLFTLTAGGGAGPLHACSLAEMLRIPEVLIPPAPGIGCSLGALVSDVREDVVMTDIQREEDADADRLRQNFGKLEKQATDALERQGFGSADRALIRTADLRYRGMRTELNVTLPEGPIDAKLTAAMFDAFHDVHHQSYGYAYRGKQQVEIVNLRVTGLGRLKELRPKAVVGSGKAAPTQRQVFFAPDGFRETPVYVRDTLAPDTAIEGPAIVEQYDTTTVIHPGQTARVDAHGNLIVRTAAAS